MHVVGDRVETRPPGPSPRRRIPAAARLLQAVDGPFSWAGRAGFQGSRTVVDGGGVDRRYCTDKLTVRYAHVGLYDVTQRKQWIARKRIGLSPLRVSHARMLAGGDQDASTAEKDRFVCYSFFTPGSGRGFVQGYPIEWDEGHVIVRAEPNWNYLTGRFVAPTDTAQVEKNQDQQYEWGERVFQAYVALRPAFAMSWHLIGTRAADSLFYIQRAEPQRL